MWCFFLENSKKNRWDRNSVYIIIFVIFCGLIAIPFLYSGIRNLLDYRYGYGIAFLIMGIVFLGLTISFITDLLVKSRREEAAQIIEEP